MNIKISCLVGLIDVSCGKCCVFFGKLKIILHENIYDGENNHEISLPSKIKELGHKILVFI